MESLPAELLDLILDRCEFLSLKNLRLVNRSFEDESTPRVFEHFYMGMFDHCLANLRDLSMSRLSKHVKRFTLFSDTLPSWSRSDWERNIDYRTSVREHPRFVTVQPDGHRSHRAPILAKDFDHSQRHDFTEQQLDDGWTEFQRFHRQQLHWKQEEHGILFKEGLAMLPNLAEVNAEPAAPFRGRTSEWPVWRRLRASMLVSPDDWMYVTDYYGEEGRADRSGQVCMYLLEAIGFRSSFAGTKQITELHTHFAHMGSFERIMAGSTPLSLSPPSHVARLSMMCEGFRHFYDIELKVPFAADPTGMHAMRCGAEVASFLSMSKNLRSLKLIYSDDETGIFVPRPPATHTLAPLLAAGRLWPHLHHLVLSTDIWPELLLPFLNSLSPSLRSLELRDMVVYDVPKLIDQIPKLLNLDHVYIECVWHENPPDTPGSAEMSYLCAFPEGTDIDEPYESAVKSYLLGLTVEMPKIIIVNELEFEEEEEVLLIQ